jgi:hypothetical protein
MPRSFPRLVILALATTAVVFGALSHHWDERGSNLLHFGGWCGATSQAAM